MAETTTTTTTPPASTPTTTTTAPPAVAEPPDGPLYFAPENEGDHLIGLPARDLTAAEVAEYARREPGLMRDALAPNPTTGRPLYQRTAPTGERAKLVERNKQAFASSPAPLATTPEGGEE